MKTFNKGTRYAAWLNSSVAHSMRRQKPAIVLMALMAVLTMACNGRKHDLAYYEKKIDSIRQAEQLKELQRKAGIVDENPARAWFDTLQHRTLPVRNAADNLQRLSNFSQVPHYVCGYFGYTEDDHLRAVMMPRSYKHDVVMLAEMKDSVNASLFLYTMTRHSHMPLDQLCIYEKTKEQRYEDRGFRYMEYFITNNYEITLMYYYRSERKEDAKPELQQSVRYVITEEGIFEEIPIIL